MFNTIEVQTKNGYRRTISVTAIASLNEMTNGTCILLVGSSEPIFCINPYDEVTLLVHNASQF